MELETALSQIGEIQRQMARTRTFRGYRSATTLLTGFIAIAAAVWQAGSIPAPGQRPVQFVYLWVGVAIASISIVAVEIALRYWRSSLERELTVLAVEQFLPCIVTGGLLTLVLCEFAYSTIWMLPGLWAIFLGLGLFASRQLLPRPIALVAAFYVVMGLCCVALGHEGMQYSAWTMGATFGIGQTAAAGVLHWSLEQNHES